MSISIEPDLIAFDTPAPRTGLCQVSYAGIVVPGIFRLRPDGAGERTVRYYTARAIEERLRKMSSHQQLEFLGATQSMWPTVVEK